MHVLITGANGFVGLSLADRLAREGQLGGRPLTRLTLVDLSFPDPLASQGWVRRHAGDLTNLAFLDAMLEGQPMDAVFHLASIPGGMAEAQYSLARRVNLDATMGLLERGRTQVLKGGAPPIFVFASSIAVLGAMPASVDDHTLPRPAMTYGSQKLIGEVLVDDFSRRGWIDGRSVRLPGVLARPSAPTGQLSAFLSNIIRELAAGRSFECPMSAHATTWASSLPCVMEQLVHAATFDAALVGDQRAITLPTLRFSMEALVESITRVYGTAGADLVRYAPDPRIETLFGTFPPLSTQRADAAGFRSDANLDVLVRQALQQG